MISLVNLAHTMATNVLRPGGLALDATVGNGHDTLFLAQRVGDRGKVLGFDIQQAAIDMTRQRLQQHALDHIVTLFHDGHEHLSQTIPDWARGKLSVVMFNLGYLPGGDKNIITKGETTLMAVRQSLEIIHHGGRIILVAYTGHCGGNDETRKIRNYVSGLSAQEYHSACYLPRYGAEKSPQLIVIEKVACQA